MDKGAILLKDHVGEKSESTLGMIKRVVSGKSAVVNILRGELVEPIPGDELAPRTEGQTPYNYRWKKDLAVLLYCHDYDIAPLSDKEFHLLEGIQTPNARYEVFISGEKLDWGCNLNPGDTVYVNIPGLTVLSNHRAAAVIRFVGGLVHLPGMPHQPGLMFGIEIMDEQFRGNGSTDGTFHGLRHFQCEDNCGLFVGLDKLSPDRQDSSLTMEPRGAKSYAKVSNRRPPHSVQSHQPDNTSPVDNTHSRSHVVSRPEGKESCVNPPPRPPHFKPGDRVVAFTKKGLRVHGTVRWIGRTVASRKFTVAVVGIETDVAVSGSDFEDFIPGMTYLFAATKNHHLFLPETTILSEEEATGANDGQRNKPRPPENIDVEDTAALAREMGVSAETLLENQKAALREAKLAKEAQEIKQLKQAIPEESLHINRQQAALHAYAEKHMEMMQDKRASLPSGGEAASNYLQASHHTGRPQRQHSYEPVVPSSHRTYLSSQTKAASIAQGEQIYNHLDSRGYQQKQSSGTVPATWYPTEPRTQPSTQNSGHQWPPPQQQQHPLYQQSSNQQAAYYQTPPQQIPYQQKQTPHQLPDVHIRDNTVSYAPNVPAHAFQHQVYWSLSIGSTVQLTAFSSTIQDGPPSPRYGVIRWVGELPGVQGPIAGIELEEPMEGCTDGTIHGQKYFDCQDGRGLYFPLASLRPDERFTDPGTYCRFDTSGNTPGTAHYDSSTKNHLPKEEERTQLKETYEIKKALQEKCAKLETQLSQAQHEKQNLQERYTHLEEQLQQQKQQHTRLEQKLREKGQEMARLRQEAAQERQEIARLRQEGAQERQEAAEVKQQLERQLQELIADNQRLQQQVVDTQTEAQRTRLIQPQRTLEAIEYWKVPRRDIQIIREVGVGAWGSVFEGKCKDQLVAVKQPHRAILTTPIVKRLQREVQIMAQVRHPNLVRFIAAVFDDKVQRLEEPPMIILELLDMNLRTAYERDILGASKIPIFRDVAYALHYLHEHQDPIIHRDISTPNVLLEALPQGAWKAKVSDFGSANLEKRSKTAAEGAIIYSAPETFPHTDPTTLPPPQTTKIDVFSYGILLCEVITKQLPEDPTIYRQMLQQVKSQWLFMYDLIVSCTKRDPNERPTMAQVLDKLNKLPRPRPRVRQHS